MDWFLICSIAFAASILLIIFGEIKARKAPVQQGEFSSSSYTQFAYVLLIGSGIGLLLQAISFSAAMLIVILITGAIWLFDIVWLKKRRIKGEKESELVENAKSFFPVILIVFLLRSFLVEPFQIPSSSMRPNLIVGDFILVNKFIYGIRLPILNTTLIETGSPKRGDVMVFHFPPNPAVDYIKRVVGLPGDKVSYQNKRFMINGQPLTVEGAGSYHYVESGLNEILTARYRETMGEKSYLILNQDDKPPVDLFGVREFPYRENCVYNDEGFICTVPAGHYLMIGDNRDNSSDSRYWGFVPERNIVGKAFFIWMNFNHFERIGHSIN